MIGALTNHLWQSTLFAIAVARAHGLRCVWLRRPWARATGHSRAAPHPVKPDDSAVISIFTALQQEVGMRIAPAKEGPGEFLVIDRKEA